MAIVWADFPSGQRGLYGTDKAKMLNGIWAAHEGVVGLIVFLQIVNDPDPAIGALGCVLRFNISGGAGGAGAIGARFTYPAAVVTAGLAFRVWLSEYPVGNTERGNPLWWFRTAANGNVCYFRIGASGQILAYNSAGTLLGESAPATVVANAYNHIETKALRDAAAGTIEVRVNGAPKLELDTLALGATNFANIMIGQDLNDSTANPIEIYYKDIVFWDGLGTYANDFQGSVAVWDLYADADVSLNWDPSVGALGYPLITDDFPSGTLTVSGLISDGNVVRIDNTYYRLSSGSLDSGAPAGTSANPWKVLIGATNADTMLNLYNAIGATGVAGTDYSTALTAHTTVDANGVTATQVSVEAKLQAASAIVTTETGANLAWAAGTLTGGPTDASYIEAPFPLPAAARFSMTQLPPDVTSIRALLPIFRGVKTDGGDCAVQAGLSPDDATWVNGADNPMTVASTYYWSPIHTNPVSAAPWTPGEVNNAYVRVNRTL